MLTVRSNQLYDQNFIAIEVARWFELHGFASCKSQTLNGVEIIAKRGADCLCVKVDNCIGSTQVQLKEKRAVVSVLVDFFMNKKREQSRRLIEANTLFRRFALNLLCSN